MKRYRKSRRRRSQRNNRTRYSRKKMRGIIKGGSSLYTAPIAAANFPLSLAPSPPFTVEQMNFTQYA